MGEECCGCGHDHKPEDHKFSVEEIAMENNFCLNALIDLLIEKKVITKEEFADQLEKLSKEQ